jgi:hypothetical protein
MGKCYVVIAIAGRPVARGKTRVNMKAEARFFGKTEISAKLELGLGTQPGAKAGYGVLA